MCEIQGPCCLKTGHSRVGFVRQTGTCFVNFETGPYITGASRDNSVTTKLFTTNTKGGHAFFSGSAIDACAFQKGISRVVKLLTLGF